MRLAAAAAAGWCAYVAVGLLTGHAPRLRPIRTRPRRRRPPLPKRRRFLAGCAGAAAVAFVVVWGLAGAAPVAVAPAVAVAVVPGRLAARRRRREARAQSAAWPDALRQVAASLAVPVSLHRALCELGRSGPAPLRAVWARYERLSPALGSLGALRAVQAELADPLSDRVVEILAVASAQGTRVVGEVLVDLADSAAADVRLAEDIETAQLEKRIEAASAAVVPFVVLVLLCSGSPPYRAFYSSAAGAAVIALGAVMALAGMAAVSRLGRLPEEPRVLVEEPGR